MKLRRTLMLTAALLAAAVFWCWNDERLMPQPTAMPQPSHGRSSSPQAQQRPHYDVPVQPSAAEAKPDVFASFSAWTDRWRSAPARQRAAMIDQGVHLAQERHAALYHLIASDPQAALSTALPEGVARFLPVEVRPWVEQRMHRRGDLAVVGITPRRGEEHLIQRAVYHEARIDGKGYDAYVYGRRARQDTKYGSSLHGIVVKDRMAVLDEPAVVLTSDQVPSGTTFQPGLALDDHVAPQTAVRGTPVLAAQGDYYPVCCAAHATLYAQRMAEAENQSGPVVDAAAGTGSQNIPAPVPQTTQGTLKGLVIIADFADFPGRPNDIGIVPATSITTSYVSQRVSTDVSDFIAQASYGKASFGSVAVTPVLRLSGNLADYAVANNITGLQSAALSAAATAGYSTSSYDRIMLVFASTRNLGGNKFNWSALGDIGGTFTWFNGDFTYHVVSHELCHNFGLRHANLWKVTDGNPVSAAGTSFEYGDVFDVMGSGANDAATHSAYPNPWFLNRIHWLPDAAVQTITTSGTYRVLRFDHPSVSLASTLALKVARDNTRDYWIGYRRKFVGSALNDVSAGAYFVWANEADARSQLIDIDTPGSDAGDASLNVGNTFNDAESGISFKVSAAGGSGVSEYLDVQVSFQSRIFFDKKSYSVDEKAGSLSIVLNRMSNSTGAVSLHYATSNATAVAGTNYIAASGDLSWTSGDATSRTITIPILQDAGTSGAVSFSFTLSSVTGAVVPGGSTVTVTIQKSGAQDSSLVAAAFNSAVRCLVAQPDGKMLVGGTFAATGSIASAGIARIENSGVLDTSFDQGPGGSPMPASPRLLVNALARQPDGKVIVGGAFTSMRNVSRSRIARLNIDGTLDNSFNPGTGPNGDVYSILVLPDGHILVGGTFLTWNGGARKALVRLNEDGSLDSSFTNFDSVVDFQVDGGTTYAAVNAMALQPTGTAPFYRVIAGGDFYRPNTGTGFHFGLVALNPETGARDSGFDVTYGAHLGGNTGQAWPVASLCVQPDGKVVVGGQFTGFNGVSCGHFIRLNSNGTNDSTFKTSSGSGITGSGYVEVSDIVQQNDGKLIFAGHFSSASGNTQNGIARYNSSGTFDTTFRPSITYNASLVGAYGLAMQPDGLIALGLNGSGAGNTIRRYFTAQPQTPSIIQFAATTAITIEGPNAVIVVERSGGSAGEAKVFYSTVARTATAGSDFTTTTGMLTWADGDATPKSINIPVINDGQVENDETFEVRLASPLGGALLGEHQLTSVLISAGDLANVPHVAFTSTSSSVTESVTTITLNVNVSPAPSAPVTVPFTLSGSATSGTGKDYTMGTTSPLSFAAGETAKSVSINVLQDALADPNETIVVTLASPVGYAVLGTDSVHTVTILDDEALPSITSSPSSRLVSVGSNTTFTVTATGTPLPTSYIWKKGTSTISGQSAASYTITNVQTTHAGSFTAQAKSVLGTSSPSVTAELAVADLRPRVLFQAPGDKVVLTIACSANVTGFQWYKDTVLINDPTNHLSGQGTKALTINGAQLTDHGNYTCVVTSPIVGVSATTGNLTVHVIDNPPQFIDPMTFPPAIVGGAFSYNLADHINTSDNLTPSSYSATPLPTGVSINTTTGLISGTPSIALTPGTSKTYNVVVKATNKKNSATKTMSLVVSALPVGSVGTFAAFVPRDSGLNNNLGGRLTIIPATAGTFSGTLIDGVTTRKFSGKLTATPSSVLVTGSCSITRTGGNLTLSFTIDASSSLISGTLTDGSHPVSISGWRNVVPTAAYVGTYNFGMNLALPNSALPQGTGYGSFKVATNGTLTVAGRLADGIAYSTSTFVGPAGQVLVHWASSTTDVVLGALTVTPGVQLDFSDYLVGGVLSWSRAQQSSSTRLYRTQFGPVVLTVEGGRYVAPTTGKVFFGLNYIAGVTTSNATLTFTTGDFGSDVPVKTPDVTVLVKPAVTAATVLLPKARATTLNVTSSSGAFYGTFTLSDANPLALSTNILRSAVPYQGLVFRTGSGLVARGYFLLNNLPRNAGETPTNTATVSGIVELNKLP